MHLIRSIIKRAIAFALYYSGILWVYAHFRLRNRAVVLMYHRVLPADADTCSDSGIVVTPSTFEDNMRFLRRHFIPLTASEFRSCLNVGRFPRRACLVTFDDGWYDNEVHALPILQDHAVPAVVFVATGYIGTGDTFWQERMTRLIVQLSRLAASESPILEKLYLGHTRAARETHKHRIARTFVTNLKNQPLTEMLQTMHAIEDACRNVGIDTSDNGDDRFMDWNSVKKLHSSGLVAICSHGHRHIPLTRLERSFVFAELQRSVQEIRSHNLPVMPMCAYPNGEHNTVVADCATASGLGIAFTTVPGVVDASNDARMLPRVNIHQSAARTRPELMCRMLSIF